MDIITNPKDYYNWDKIIEHATHIDGISEYDRKRIESALILLRAELGEDFLKEASDGGHPFFKYIRNLAPWTRLWMAWLAETIKSLKPCNNYEAFRSTLVDPVGFDEAISWAEYAYKFAQTDFQVDFEPEVYVNDRLKKPDLLLYDDHCGLDLYAEISISEQSNLEQDAWHTFQSIAMKAFWNAYSLNCTFHVKQPLSNSHLNNILSHVEEAITAAQSTNEMRTFERKGVIDFAVAPDGDKDKLIHWAFEKGLEFGSQLGPRIETDELQRLKVKIDKEMGQLPRHNTNILILKTKQMMRIDDWREAIRILREKVFEHPNLLGLIIYGVYGGTGDNNSFVEGPNVYIRHRPNPLLTEESIWILNSYFSDDICPHALSNIYRSLEI